MNHCLQDTFRHNAWATQTLLDYCRNLTDEQLAQSVAGVYGDIRATLQHMVLAEANYHRLLTGIPSAIPWTPDTPFSFDDLDDRVAELAEFWEKFQATPFDAGRLIPTRDDDGKCYETAAGVILTQALNHGNDHRSQICTIITTLGMEPPEIDGWTYGIVSGRIMAR